MTFTGSSSIAGIGPEPVRAEGTAPMVAAPGLRKEDLHASVSDPVLDTLNFLNEISLR
jgi:(S)-3,5-dihydroxyphenylglycine transaminase